MSAPGWPVVLRDPESGVMLRPYRRSDASAWSECRIANEAWLAVWEPTPPRGTWADLNSRAAYRMVHRELRRVARLGVAMPFAVCLRDPSGRDRLGSSRPRWPSSSTTPSPKAACTASR